MPWNSFKNMSDNDLKAIYNYLKTVQPLKRGEDAALAEKQASF
jgi:hypothetical protein